MRQQLIAAMAMIILSSAPASAQSAEETAAYLLFGLEDEAYTTVTGLTDQKQVKVWKDMEEPNIWYSMIVNNSTYAAYVISQTDECVFDVDLHVLRTRDDSPIQNTKKMSIDTSALTSANFGSMFGERFVEFNRLGSGPIDLRSAV